MPEIKILLLILTMLKLLFFIRVFEGLGFLVQIILKCCIDLVPFVVSYLVFLLIFTLSFLVLHMEVDGENQTMQHIGTIAKMYIETFRSSIGEVGLPTYTKLLETPESFMRDVDQFLIWALWFIQVFFMLVIMLNFLIAVLQQTYTEVMKDQQIILYQQRAELNEECNDLLSLFVKLKKYKYIVFSTVDKELQKYKKEYDLNDISQGLQLEVIRNKRRILQMHHKLQEKILTIRLGIRSLKHIIEE